MTEAASPSLIEIDQASRWQAARNWLGRAAVATAISVPLAASGAVVAAELAPPAHVPLHIAGGDITAQANFGGNAMEANLQVADLSHYDHIRYLGKDIGVNVAFHINKIDLANPNGSGIDTSKAKLVIDDFSDIKAETDEIKSTLEDYYAKAATDGAVVVCGIGFLIYGYRTIRRRQLDSYSEDDREAALKDRELPKKVGRSLGVVAVSGLVGSAAALVAWPNHSTTLTPDPALAGGELAGWSISGPASGLITDGANFITKRDKFSALQEANLKTALQNKFGATSIYPPSGDKMIIFADDPQGQDLPLRIVGDTARAMHASLIEIGGDIEATESSLETSELDAIKSHSGGIPIEMTRGHHDDPNTIVPEAAARGIRVADGEPNIINGINIMGVNAPDLIPFNGQDELLHPNPKHPNETLSEATQKLIHDTIVKACASPRPVIVTMHDKAIGRPLSEANCPSVPVVLDGRQYYTSSPINYGNTVEITSDSAGGHEKSAGLEAFGIPHHDAYFEALEINSDEQLVSAYRFTLLPPPSGEVLITDDLPVKGKPNPSLRPAVVFGKRTAASGQYHRPEPGRRRR